MHQEDKQQELHDQKDMQSPGPRNFFIKNLPERVKKETLDYLKRREEKLAQNDIVFSEPLHKKEEKEEVAPLVKGSIDMWFLFWSAVLVCFGAIMSYSASAVYAEQKFDDSAYFLWRYVLFALAAIVVTIVFVVIAKPWMLRYLAVGSYGLSIVLLLAVLVFGLSEGDAQRWIAIGPITIQPSEIAKMAVVMMLALYMSKYEKEISSTHAFGGSFKRGVLVPMIIIGIICSLVMLESHISGLMIIGVLGVCVMFMAGTRVKWLLMMLGLIGIAGVFLILVSSYAQTRVDIWLNIDKVDPRGAAWQTLQGLYAIGSGGFFGLGLGSSRQKFGYVSQPQNDFIFTIICEELGFVGAFAVILVFCMLIWRGIKIGQRAPDKFCALTVWGLTFKIGLQVAMNIAVVTNSMPNTGISLPFFSSGGTSLMLQIFEIGIILCISRFSYAKKE